MKQYYQGEDIPFSVPFSSEFRNAESFFEFSEIRSYAYTDGCLIQKFSTVNKSGYGKLTTINGELSGIIRSEYSSRFSPGAIIIEIIGMKQSSELQYDIGKTVIGGLKKSLIKNEKLDGNIFLSLDKNSINFDANTSETVTVTITGTDNKSFTVSNTPSWLTVTKTNAGFTLTAAPNPKEYPRDVKLTVSSDAYPSASASLSVTQEGAWLSEFVFDVKTTAINQDIPR
ncbi:MAG: BACON domain-containing protein, partial [Candidatus Azobacteroides sp.]|nr:BACON domain-containing protein [Candidatus Azobacteroides sp.]